MKTSRQKILDHLAKNRAVSAREIARALNMSAADVRHHLRVLAADGRAEETSSRRREGKGRPEKLYSLSRRALGDNLAALADVLLTATRSKVRMEELGKNLSGETIPSGQSVAKRLSLLIEKINAMNYHARWEAGADGPRIILGQCPYAKIIEGHPELCAMDAALLTELMKMKVEQRAKLSPSCVFSL